MFAPGSNEIQFGYFVASERGEKKSKTISDVRKTFADRLFRLWDLRRFQTISTVWFFNSTTRGKLVKSKCAFATVRQSRLNNAFRTFHWHFDLIVSVARLNVYDRALSHGNVFRMSVSLRSRHVTGIAQIYYHCIGHNRFNWLY